MIAYVSMTSEVGHAEHGHGILWKGNHFSVFLPVKLPKKAKGFPRIKTRPAFSNRHGHRNPDKHLHSIQQYLNTYGDAT